LVGEHKQDRLDHIGVFERRLRFRGSQGRTSTRAAGIRCRWSRREARQGRPRDQALAWAALRVPVAAGRGERPARADPRDQGHAWASLDAVCPDKFE
jgi:hypothetical protein